MHTINVEHVPAVHHIIYSVHVLVQAYIRPTDCWDVRPIKIVGHLRDIFDKLLCSATFVVADHYVLFTDSDVFFNSRFALSGFAEQLPEFVAMGKQSMAADCFGCVCFACAMLCCQST